MGSLLFLVASAIGLAVFVGPIFSIVNFVRMRGQRQRLDELTRAVEALERQVRELGATPVSAGTAATTAAAADAHHARATDEAPSIIATAPPAAVVPPEVPPSIQPPPPPIPPAATFPPAETAPPPSAVPPRQDDLDQAATAPAAVASSAAAAPPAPPLPAAPAFDWESLLGIRGAAWLGGITIVIAALFFARWSIDQGFFTPAIRVATMLVAGVSALAWAEVTLRRGYRPTANAVSGAAVVTLYAAFYAGHGLYRLFDLPFAFAGMAFTTIAAAAVAVRHAALFTAIVGVVGGLATPLLLSTATDRPLGLFAYLTTLAAGFLHVAERRRWPVVTAFLVIGTTLIETAWLAARLTPATLVAGLGGFAALGAAYLWHVVRTAGDEAWESRTAATVGAVVSLVAAVAIAADVRFAAHWPIVVADAAAIAAALIWIGLTCAQPALPLAAALGWSALAAAAGGVIAPELSSAWALAGTIAAVAGALSAVPHLAVRRGASWLDDSTTLASVVRAAPWVGLLLFVASLADAARPTPLVVALVAVLFALAADATRGQRRPGLLAIAATLIGLVCWHWLDAAASPRAYAVPLALPHLAAIAVAALAWWRGAAPGMDERSRAADSLAVVAATAVAFASLLTSDDRLTSAALFTTRTYVPATMVYLWLFVDVALMLLVAIRAGWTWLVPAAAAGAAAFALGWHARFGPGSVLAVTTAYLAIYTGFLVCRSPPSAAAWAAGPRIRHRGSPPRSSDRRCSRCSTISGRSRSARDGSAPSRWRSPRRAARRSTACTGSSAATAATRWRHAGG